VSDRIPVSVAIITKNEEVNIGDALESVKEFEDIVVIDSFSTDRTPEICRRYTGRFIQHEWQGYARQKQMAVDYAAKDWVFILDADERVTPELKTEIKEKIKDTPFSGFYIPRKNFFLGRWIRHSGWWPDHTLRLFRKDVSYVQQREVHEKVVVEGSVGYMKAPIEHYTYRTISDYINKMEIYTTLSARELVDKKSITPIVSMMISPVFVFFKMFFLRQGFRDGIHGLVLATLYSMYTFLKYVKIWEHRRVS
jgi:glycosyltransferase involved in cell wall biosynthesis